MLVADIGWVHCFSAETIEWASQGECQVQTSFRPGCSVLRQSIGLSTSVSVSVSVDTVTNIHIHHTKMASIGPILMDKGVAKANLPLEQPSH